MPLAALPDDEAARLAELHSYDILDTAADPRFDTFVRLASKLYDTPIALVSLVDGRRQWFKATIGLGDTSETPREHSFCAHAILNPNEVMVVEDATLDPRFAANALVTGRPDIRFYAGAPIVGASGHALGTLCILDTRSRRFNAQEREHLAELASGVGSVLELHGRMQAMKRAATHDPLTGLANRALFEPELEAAVAAARTGANCAVLCLDLDHFKAVNDTYGHAAGDSFLCKVALRLRAVIRPGDMAARLGGDEFAVLMRGPLLANAPQLLAERIMGALTPPVVVNGESVLIRSSIGYAASPPHLDSASLLRAADVALYAAKAAGRGIVIASGQQGVAPPKRPSPEQNLDEPASMVRDLRHALATDAFVLHWQPYFTAATSRVRGFEALLRWDRPAHGPVPPDTFIPVAEACGLIADIDNWVLEAACKAAAAWSQPLTVSVNVSPNWLCREHGPRVLADILARTRLDPGRLMLELTERVVTACPAETRIRIAQLHDLGVRLAIDDFGIGHSSLACLKDFEFDKIKLDRSFIKDVETEAKARDVVRAILALGRVLQMPVCAEGVETDFQLNFLKAEQCHIVQGYLLGRPALAAEWVSMEATEVEAAA